MAGTPDSRFSYATENELSEIRKEVDELKRDLEGWRQALLLFRGLLMWEQPYYPAVLFGVTTFVFALIWFLEPSVMTTIGVLGLVITTIDFAVPFISPYIFSTQQWTGREEQQFEDICEGILFLRTRVHHVIKGLAVLKTERPIVYFLLVMGILTVISWIGYIMNNLFLTYLIVLTILMVPGLQQKGLIQRYLLKYWLIFKRLVFGRFHVFKSKAK